MENLTPISQIGQDVKFGTSGVRGLVNKMTEQVCYAYTGAFLQHLNQAYGLKQGSSIALAGDLRPSTPRILKAIAAAIRDFGYHPLNCGLIPTPAVANLGIQNKIPSIMVTGSHIPADRNGIKFYTPYGEILKTDEQQILQKEVEIPSHRFDKDGQLLEEQDLPKESRKAYQAYVDRYVNFFPADDLENTRVGLYQHSAVSRNIFRDILESLGATVIPLGYSETFIPVDTEAIRPEDVVLAKKWAMEHRLDCIVSTDGDGDRPLISDENGNWLRGDITGLLCAKSLNADVVVLPINCNTAVEKCKAFKQVIRTKIGSPYVIEKMQEHQNDHDVVVGYEANGGFLLGSEIKRGERSLSPLPTRDAVLLPLVILTTAQKEGLPISKLLEDLPLRFTSSDRLKDFPTEQSQSLLDKLSAPDPTQGNVALRDLLGQDIASLSTIDQTDGIRITLENDEIIHFRPSGNAPELRCYVEAATEARSQDLNNRCLHHLKKWKGS